MEMTVRRTTERARSLAGFTILEIAVTMAVLSLVVAGSMTLVLRIQLSYQEELQQYALDQTGRRTLDRLGEEIRGASLSTIVPAVLTDSPTIQFQRVIGYAGGAVQFGPAITIQHQPEPGETINGLDDDGDGRTDEGFLVYSEDGSTPFNVAGNVTGMRFNSTPLGVSFSVDIALLGRDSQVLLRTFTEQISFRN